MKAYTDLEQSKKLAEILQHESADMYWDYDVQKHEDYAMVMDEQFDDLCIPCWSLAALLEIIPSDLGSSTLTIDKCDSEPFKYGLNYHDRWGREDDIQTKYYDNLVDACYEMIIKLYEQKLL